MGLRTSQNKLSIEFKSMKLRSTNVIAFLSELLAVLWSDVRN
jgi:hypothetical protein